MIKDPLDTRFISHYIKDNVFFDLEQCVKDYMNLTHLSYQEAYRIVKLFYYKHFDIININTLRSVNHRHPFIKFIFQYIICYLITKQIPTSLDKELVALLIYPFLSLFIITIRHYTTHYNMINDKLIIDHIINNQFNINLCVKDYLHYQKNENEEKAKKEIIEYFSTHFKIVEKKHINNQINHDFFKKRNSLFSSNITTQNHCPYCGSHHIHIIEEDLATYSEEPYGPLLYPEEEKGLGFTFYSTKQYKKNKKVFSKRKSLLALISGGVSFLFTGLKSKVSSKCICDDCHKTFYKK